MSGCLGAAGSAGAGAGTGTFSFSFSFSLAGLSSLAGAFSLLIFLEIIKRSGEKRLMDDSCKGLSSATAAAATAAMSASMVVGHYTL